MSISYSSERKGWDISQATQDETRQLLEAGLRFLTQHWGASMLKAESEREDAEAMLDQTPKEEMAQA